LGNNQFGGQLPDSFKKLTNLRLLGLDNNNQLKGNINDLLGNMRQVEYLYLEDNFFDGELDGLIDRWPILDGKMPNALMNHPTLMVADLHRNVFGHQFPDDIFENTKLEFLALHNNIISGTIPDRVAFLSNLKHLDLSLNKLTGTIPDTVGTLKDLRYLAMSANPFQDQPLVDFRQ
jgi:Leucine-rich repeat (LRR) protein